MTSVVLRDVTLRDGLQDESPIATEEKLAVFEALVAAGVTDLELTSFVRSDRVPAMADAEALVAATVGRGVRRWGLVLNRRGADRAVAAGLTDLQAVVSVSGTHSRANAGLPTEDAMDIVAGIAALPGATVELTLGTTFGCPYEGVVDPGRVIDLAVRAVATGVTAIGLADTIGVAIPSEVAGLVTRVEQATGVPVGVHLHDTRGLAIANALAAVDAGAVRVDGSVGGLGGCPFAPGASGNLALEDLAHALEAMGVVTGVSVEGLIHAAEVACAAVGRTVDSHVGRAGPRFARLATP